MCVMAVWLHSKVGSTKRVTERLTVLIVLELQEENKGEHRGCLRDVPGLGGKKASIREGEQS